MTELFETCGKKHFIDIEKISLQIKLNNKKYFNTSPDTIFTEISENLKKQKFAYIFLSKNIVCNLPLIMDNSYKTLHNKTAWEIINLFETTYEINRVYTLKLLRYLIAHNILGKTGDFYLIKKHLNHDEFYSLMCNVMKQIHKQTKKKHTKNNLDKYRKNSIVRLDDLSGEKYRNQIKIIDKYVGHTIYKIIHTSTEPVSFNMMVDKLLAHNNMPYKRHLIFSEKKSKFKKFLEFVLSKEMKLEFGKKVIYENDSLISVKWKEKKVKIPVTSETRLNPVIVDFQNQITLDIGVENIIEALNLNTAQMIKTIPMLDNEDPDDRLSLYYEKVYKCILHYNDYTGDLFNTFFIGCYKNISISSRKKAKNELSNYNMMYLDQENEYTGQSNADKIAAIGWSANDSINKMDKNSILNDILSNCKNPRIKDNKAAELIIKFYIEGWDHNSIKNHFFNSPEKKKIFASKWNAIKREFKKRYINYYKGDI